MYYIFLHKYMQVFCLAAEGVPLGTALYRFVLFLALSVPLCTVFRFHFFQLSSFKGDYGTCVPFCTVMYRFFNAD
jgi:hypothetical protein